jgi:hypothetical protein
MPIGLYSTANGIQMAFLIGIPDQGWLKGLYRRA